PGAFAGDEWTALLESAGFAGPFRPDTLPAPVLVHEPCTGRFGARGPSAALRLLRAAGVDARPFEGAACCGGAAPFLIDAPDLSRDLGAAARAAVAASGARTLVTSDPGCLLQFSAAGGAEGSAAPVVLHLATALLRLVEPAAPR
ncbi:MAG TPA: heterodisulfide reductase-related iron-sulfur binding cluster, partial [Planctomycetota bacterium]|nr:heterodisulfide reductase-related iron-sulfur binding cluster [Planctomycetota bacterium]